jgi:hypothetical protein
MRKWMATVLIFCCALVIISSCSLGGGQSSGVMTTQTSQLEDTTQSQLFQPETQPTTTPLAACQITGGLMISGYQPNYRWADDSQLFYFVNPANENEWCQYVLETGEINQVSLDIPLGRNFPQTEITPSNRLLPEDTSWYTWSPSNEAVIYASFCSVVDIAPTPSSSPTPTPTFNPTYGPIRGEEWIGGILVYTYEFIYANASGEQYSLGTINGDAFNITWLPDESGALIERYIVIMDPDWTSPEGIWFANFGTRSLVEVDYDTFHNENIVLIGVSPNNEYLLYYVNGNHHLYIYELDTQIVTPIG